MGVIVVLLKKKPEPKKKKSSPKPLTNLPAPDAPAPAPLPLSEDVDEYGDEAEDENTVGSWEDLPAETTWTLMKLELTGSKQTMATTGIRIQTELGQSG